LYSPNKYRNESRDSCLDLKTGATAPRTANTRCDVLYGNLYAGADLDWFESSSDRGSRTVIRDLGLLSWSEPIQVPVVPPLPRLLPGQRRTVTIDTSGADGADGTPGTPGNPAPMLTASSGPLVRHRHRRLLLRRLQRRTMERRRSIRSLSRPSPAMSMSSTSLTTRTIFMRCFASTRSNVAIVASCRGS
jgi:hypothetical protein